MFDEGKGLSTAKQAYDHTAIWLTEVAPGLTIKDRLRVLLPWNMPANIR